jgi:hypothetical protein
MTPSFFTPYHDAHGAAAAINPFDPALVLRRLSALNADILARFGQTAR